jgi:PhnB protein
MSSKRDYIQGGFSAVTPYVYGGLKLIEFLKEVFDAKEVHVGTPDETGQLHAELSISDSPLMVGSGYFADSSMAAAIWVYVPQVDATYKRALKAGAASVREPADQTWGDRVCGVKDSFGNTWWIATHKAPK